MPVQYLSIQIDNKTFNRIIRFATKCVGANSNLEIKEDIEYYIKQLNLKNEFIRLKHKKYYIDLSLDKYIVKDQVIIIMFNNVIDFNRTKFIPDEKC